jgi:hypothetical protein
MDDIVNQAMAKWPNVPHCYGWLALDARGAWRMRDERAQALGLAGERIVHAALLGFINRNYAHDDRGCWYFQNGPQRVYVNLEATPYIARTDAMTGFSLHTEVAIAVIDNAWMTETGQLVLECGEKIALVDDRDMARYVTDLRVDGKQATDEQLVAWLHQSENGLDLMLQYSGGQVPVRYIVRDKMAAHFGFVQLPQPAAAAD